MTITIEQAQRAFPNAWRAVTLQIENMRSLTHAQIEPTAAQVCIVAERETLRVLCETGADRAAAVFSAPTAPCLY